ncbi:MAG: hypothetical protein NTU49_01260, partial [Gammaproteobacteria bacterium]|nr:hypothetical protein [Gammaproteobacteria bacterium]
QQANTLEFWEQAAFKGIQDTPNKMNFLDVAELAMPLIDLLVAKFNPVAKTADKATQSEETWPATTTNSWSDYLPSWPTRLTLWSSPATAPKSVAPAQETKPVSTLNA